LATVYAIVKQSSGSIEVHSKLGHGSSFKIYLPAAEQADADYESATGAAKPVFSGETVLVVEDAKPHRRLIWP
jgi:two-component system, cell cycle sensor histidine kinase and response regulator CckA